jgi:ParB-like chromosome segregation protein Spo0J
MTEVIRIHSSQTINISDVHPYENNPRAHSEEQIQMLMRLISEFGFTNPVLVDENYKILAGHGRVLAAQRLGMHEVPYVVIRGLTDKQKKAYIIGDNRSGELSSWDKDILTSEFLFLNDSEFDVSVLGFAEEEVAYFLNGATLDDAAPQQVPEAQAENNTQVSDLVTFSIKLEPSDKSRLLRLIKSAKDRGLYDTDSEALMSLFDNSEIG